MLKKLFTGKFGLFLGLCLLVGGYRFYTAYNKHEDSNKVETDPEAPMQAKDTAMINTVYAKLAALYKTVAKDTVHETEAYADIDTTKLPEDFEPKAITLSLLQYLFDSTAIATQPKAQRDTWYKANLLYRSAYRIQNLNASLGNGDVVPQLAAHQYDKAFRRNMQQLVDGRYLMVLVDRSWKTPDYNESTGTFASGSYTGSLKVYDLSTGKKVGGIEVFALNSSDISVIPSRKEEMERKLTENLHENIRKVVSRCAVAFFGKSL